MHASAITVGMINKIDEQIKLVNFISYKFILVGLLLGVGIGIQNKTKDKYGEIFIMKRMN